MNSSDDQEKFGGVMKNDHQNKVGAESVNETLFEEKLQELFDETAEEAFEEEKRKLDEVTQNKKLIISLYGNVNAGKSTTINALTGRKLSEVSAYSGSTTNIKVHEYFKDVLIADTPGLRDINKINSKKAEEYIEKDTDIVLFFFKANGTTGDEYQSLKNIVKAKKPVIVVLNFIDIWYNGEELVEKEDMETVIKQISSEIERIKADLKMPDINISIIPISAKKEINIRNLNTEIIKLLQDKGKDMLYLKATRYKQDEVKVWIIGASITAAGIGAIPIPGADIAPLTALQVGMALKIAYIYNCKVNKQDVMQLIGATITGTVGKQIYRLGLQLMKGAGWFGGPFGTVAVATLAALIAGSATYGFGWACNAYYKSGMKVDLGEIGKIYKENYNTYFKNNREKTIKE